MKRITTAFILLITLSVLSSCTKTIYSDRQVMARYQNKQQVIAGFGQPEEKITVEGKEQWVYSPGKITGNYSPGDTAKKASPIVTENQPAGARPAKYIAFVKFTFDSQGNVLKWESKNVSNAVKVKDKGHTHLLILAGVLLVALEVITAVNHHGIR